MVEPIYVLFAFLIGILVGLIIADHIVFGSFGPWFSHFRKAKKILNQPCPHGWENWDDCPDCCH